MLPCLSSLWRSAAPPHDNQDGDSETKVFDTESHKAVLKRDRQTTVLRGICGFLAVAVIYLLSELLIWGFSFALAPAQLQFFSSVFGMLLVFTIMLSFYCFLPRIDNIYGSHIKGKVRQTAVMNNAALTFHRSTLLTDIWALDLQFQQSC